MDILSEIVRLPQFYYALKSRDIILGGNTGGYDKRALEYEYPIDRLYGYWKEIKEYYEKDGEKEILSCEDKKDYALIVHKIMELCDGRKMERNELEEKISILSDEDKKEIEWQIDMYERGRRYYGEYVRNR
ncbi:MAG: hypothetical protein NC079_10745 [Clostridium sp.]|nr:hypothetical protein [Acetatifactor muris]MCM1525779.1 hypothetical protein [Bacteroides sp.]MCM1564067.1 hypothetical protein [Clostridium sp.]